MDSQKDSAEWILRKTLQNGANGDSLGAGVDLGVGCKPGQGVVKSQPEAPWMQETNVLLWGHGEAWGRSNHPTST